MRAALVVPDLSDLIGVPFVDLGRDPATGLDCWGLNMVLFRRAGVEVPDYGNSVPSAYASDESDAQYRQADTTGLWLKLDKPEVMALVVMSTDRRIPRAVNHFGVCLGSGKFIHIMRTRACEIQRLGAIEWAPRIRGYHRWQG